MVYIYKKQLEEAQIILMNKVETLEPGQQEALQQKLEETYPNATVIPCSSRSGDGLDAWFDQVSNTEMTFGETMSIDYTTYGEGEAELGWLNAAIQLHASDWIDGNALLKQLADQMQAALSVNDLEIAHLKMTLAPEDETGGLAIINLVGSEFDAEASQQLMDDVERGEIILNIRAEAPPEALEAVVRQAVAACSNAPDTQLELEHLERFAPAPPEPVYREGPDSLEEAGK